MQGAGVYLGGGGCRGCRVGVYLGGMGMQGAGVYLGGRHLSPWCYSHLHYSLI